MDPKSNQPAGGNRRSGNKPKISNYSLIGLASAVSAAFFLHNQLLANSLLGGINDTVTVILVNIAPVVAVVMSYLGIRNQRGRSEMSRMMGWVGLVIGLGALMVSVTYSYSILNDSSILGVYDSLFDSINDFNF